MDEFMTAAAAMVGLILAPHLFRKVFGSRFAGLASRLKDWSQRKARESSNDWLLDWIVVENVTGKSAEFREVIKYRTLGQLLFITVDLIAVIATIRVVFGQSAITDLTVAIPIAIYIWTRSGTAVLWIRGVKHQLAEGNKLGALRFGLIAPLAFFTPALTVWSSLLWLRKSFVPLVGYGLANGSIYGGMQRAAAALAIFFAISSVIRALA